MTVRTADNWNLRTGRRFALCDLFPRHRDCRQMILRQIITQIARTLPPILIITESWWYRILIQGDFI